MLFTCAPAGSVLPGRFPGTPRGRGKHWCVDIHCHVHSTAAADMVKGLVRPEHEPAQQFSDDRTRAVGREQMQRIMPQLTSVERRLADMDAMGIDIQALAPSPAQTYYWAEPDLGLATARAVNDNIAAIVADHPDRFVGMGTVPLQEPELALRELDRIVGSLGFRGVEINTNVAGEDLSSGRLRTFFARAEELGVVVFVHPIGFTEGRRLTEHYFNNVIGNPLESTLAVGHLIFGGVLEGHPGLKVVVAHGGGYLPAYSGRLDHAAAARPDCCVHLGRMPSDYLRQLHFDTIVFDPDQLRYLVSRYGADHVLLGTDYPYDMGDNDPIGFIESAGLDAADVRAIMGVNAARLLGLEVPAEKART
jgi:aminocarboxymuconate-semialdehyde decarboxylase